MDYPRETRTIRMAILILIIFMFGVLVGKGKKAASTANITECLIEVHDFDMGSDYQHRTKNGVWIDTIVQAQVRVDCTR